MRGTKGIGFAIALVVAMATARAEAEGLNSVSCSGFVLGYSGQVGDEKCRTQERQDNNGADTVSQIEINDSRFYLVATYYKSKFRSYYHFQSTREIAGGNTSFSQITSWKDLPDTHGFKIAIFSAVLAAQKNTISCAIFIRFSGATTSAAEYDEGPGSKNLIEGYYCPQSGFPATAPGSTPIVALEDDIGRLHVPAE